MLCLAAQLPQPRQQGLQLSKTRPVPVAAWLPQECSSMCVNSMCMGSAL